MDNKRKIIQGNKESLFSRIFHVLLLLIFFVIASTSMMHKSSTWDETVTFGIGNYLMKNFRWDVPGSILHPPLPFYLNSIPNLLVNQDNHVWDYRTSDKKNIEFLGSVDISRGQSLLSSPANENDRMLNRSRLMIVFLAVILGYFIYVWGKELYGKKGALLSLLFFAFSPNLLAHSRLITPDMTVTTFMFISTFFFWKNSKYPSRKYSYIGGLFFGLALLSKFTSLLLLPIYGILFLTCKIHREKLRIKSLLIFIGTGLFILFLGYGFNITPYLQGIIFQLQHAADGHSSFLCGRHSSSGFWYFFIIAFILKTPIPTLVLITCSFYLYIKNLDRHSRINELYLLVPIIFVFLFFSIKHQSIGLRYILPIYPFLFVFLGQIVKHNFRIKIVKYTFSILLFWYISATLFIYPHYLSYFNEIAGGPGNGYKYLLDSNLDWGQDLKGLKEYMVKNNIKKINLSYFGTDSPERYDIDYNWLPSFYLKKSVPNEKISLPIKGFIAISATNLQGLYFKDKNLYAWLKKYEPVEKIGNSIFIYNIK